jgi:hypothetical protein
MSAFKDPKFDKKKLLKAPSPFAPQPSFDSRKRIAPAGENYGTGIRAKLGKMRSDSVGMRPIPQNKMNIDPRSLA